MAGTTSAITPGTRATTGPRLVRARRPSVPRASHRSAAESTRPGVIASSVWPSRNGSGGPCRPDTQFCAMKIRRLVTHDIAPPDADPVEDYVIAACGYEAEN